MRTILPSVVLAAVLGLAAGSPAAAQSAAPNGEQLFRQRCQACHSAASGKKSPLGPNLAGVVGRKAASSSYAAYSPALRKSGLTWTAANLDRFLSGPTKLVPGTKMVVSVTDKAQRAALIQYLAKTR